MPQNRYCIDADTADEAEFGCAYIRNTPLRASPSGRNGESTPTDGSAVGAKPLDIAFPPFVWHEPGGTQISGDWFGADEGLRMYQKFI